MSAIVTLSARTLNQQMAFGVLALVLSGFAGCTGSGANEIRLAHVQAWLEMRTAQEHDTEIINQITMAPKADLLAFDTLGRTVSFVLEGTRADRVKAQVFTLDGLTARQAEVEFRVDVGKGGVNPRITAIQIKNVAPPIDEHVAPPEVELKLPEPLIKGYGGFTLGMSIQEVDHLLDGQDGSAKPKYVNRELNDGESRFLMKSLKTYHVVERSDREYSIEIMFFPDPGENDAMRLGNITVTTAFDPSFSRTLVDELRNKYGECAYETAAEYVWIDTRSVPGSLNWRFLHLVLAESDIRANYCSGAFANVAGLLLSEYGDGQR